MLRIILKNDNTLHASRSSSKNHYTSHTHREGDERGYASRHFFTLIIKKILHFVRRHWDMVGK